MQIADCHMPGNTLHQVHAVHFSNAKSYESLHRIENLWAWTVQEWPSNMPHNIQGLRNHVQNRWAEIGRPLCENLVGSMQRRLEDVIAAGGFYTRY